MEDVPSTDKLLNPVEKNTSQPQDENMQMILKEVYSKDNIEMKTELTKRQINAYAKALLFADEFKSDLLRDAAEQLMILLVSKGRQGRKEWAQMIQKTADEPLDTGGIASRLLGGV